MGCSVEDLKKEKSLNSKTFWSLIIGSVTTALLASTCCLSPLLFLLFGVSASSLSFLEIFAPYHELFSFMAVGVLGYLWYNYFIKIRKMIVCEGWVCKYYLVSLNIGTLLVAILLSYQYWVIYFIGE